MVKIDGVNYDRLKIDKSVHRYCRAGFEPHLGERLYYDSVSAVLEKYKPLE